MPDFLKKAQRREDNVCEPDEEMRAALFVRPRNGDETKYLGAPGGMLSKMGRLADQSCDETNIFDRNCVLVLTNRRILAFGHGSLTGRLRSLVGSLPLGDVADIEIETPPDEAATLRIAFTDGESVSVTPGSRRRRFIEAFESTKSAAVE